MHTPYNNFVIAARIDVFRTTFEARREVGKNRYTMQPLSALKAAELVLSALGKAIAQVFLMQRQNVYGKVICFDEYVVTQ